MSSGANNRPTYARITGTGSYLPGEPVSNPDLVARGIDTSDEWIIERTGIRYRHFVASDETTGAMAKIASERALAMAGLDAGELDLIVLATSTPDFVFPSTACLLQGALGNHGATVFDVQAVCSGFVYALAVADKFIRSGTHKKALVVGSDAFSNILDWQDRGTCVLFGDGAGAVVLEAAAAPGVLSSVLRADGAQADILSVPGQVRCGRVWGDPFLRMEGQAVFRNAVRVLVSVAEECCRAAGMETREIDWLIPHQANIRIIDATSRKMGLAREKVIVTVDRHGNTSAASVPLALDEAVRDGRIRKGQRVLLEGVGGGFTWGAVLFEF
ncbi:MAG: ketoacyl-ACP synthase III [Betaproteobacteria bacterium]|nr:ketoacyl-ACP synthase III [Betaproteobacteria bacterium]